MWLAFLISKPARPVIQFSHGPAASPLTPGSSNGFSLVGVVDGTWHYEEHIGVVRAGVHWLQKGCDLVGPQVHTQVTCAVG